MRNSVSSGTPTELHETVCQIIVSSRGNEAPLDNSFDAADIEQTKGDVDMLFKDELDKI